ncbi:MAG TPA: ATP phosphoribosyltransferase [Gemmatimonadales bacterium]
MARPPGRAFFVFAPAVATLPGTTRSTTPPFMLRIALPNKGRLADDARALFADAGLEAHTSGDRALTASLGGEFEAIFVRAADIPEFVADGAADVGVTGWDLVSESGRELREMLDLGFGACRIVVAATEESRIATLDDIPGDGRPTRVATVFPRITERFFAARGQRVTVVPVSGACESAPHLGIADVVVDITSTGSTLRTNGLREVATVLRSTARLVATPAMADGPGGGAATTALGELTTALESVLRARGQRYVMANVPRAALDAVKQVLPGLRGPTVVDVLDGGTHVAVHAVAPARSIYRTIAQLRQLGGEGILVTRIERLMP